MPDRGLSNNPLIRRAGTKIGTRCKTHKRDGDIDVINKRCQALGCTKQPCFGAPGTAIGNYCKIHKNTGDINVTDKRCLEPGCSKAPTYGEPETKICLYCQNHKHPNHINIKCRQCLEPGCSKQPIYGESKTSKELYCASHKYTDDVDVINKYCLSSGCSTQARYGKPGCESDRCFTHIEAGIIVYPRRRCEKCLEPGIWGRNLTTKERRCEVHRHTDDINLIEGHCSSCGLESILDKQNICLHCGEIGKIKHQFLEKQKRVKAAIEGEFKIKSYDKIIDSGICSKKRPDFIIQGKYRDLVLEVDEYQHTRSKDYGPDCEYRRMWDITQALGTATVFVRYNPDPYVDQVGNRCNPVESDREKVLVAWIKTLLEREPPDGGFACVIYLYYDGFSIPENVVEQVLNDPIENFTKPPSIYLTELAVSVDELSHLTLYDMDTLYSLLDDIGI